MNFTKKEKKLYALLLGLLVGFLFTKIDIDEVINWLKNLF